MISGSGDAGTAGTLLPAPTLDELHHTLTRWAAHHGAGLAESELVEQITAMERLKSRLAAAQARLTAAWADKRLAAEAAAGVPADQRCRGLAAEVGLARRESPVKGAQHLGLAKVLVHELPHTLAALTSGEITEWRATLVARETAVLSRAHRAQVDRELAGKLTAAGDKQVAALAGKIGYRLDPGSALRRVRGATTDRRVGLRPAPDTMTYLTGFLPVAQGVACHAALTRQADTLRAAGDPRTRGQIMADTLVERLTGQSTAEAVAIEINLVMTDTTLFAGDQQPAHLDGYGPIPAPLARQLTLDADKAWVRRLFTNPTGTDLVDTDTKRRLFDGPRRRLLLARDQFCRNPWCDAPIRHADHITKAADGGPTTVGNGQGLCEACNYTKEAPGWASRRIPGTRHTVETRTPTGHTYTSQPPDPPGAVRKRRIAQVAALRLHKSPIEIRLKNWVA